MSKMEPFEFEREQLSIRSQESFAQGDTSLFSSASSEQSPPGQISQLIQNIIEEERKKYIVSKSHKINQTSEEIKQKKHSSNSSTLTLKPTILLPIHISRIFNSSKRYPDVPLLEKTERTIDAIYGAFFGFFIGDVTGAYLAFNNQRLDLFVPNSLLMNGGGTYNLGSGQGTDQTELLLATCYGLIQGKGVYDQNIMSKKYLEWIESKPFNFSTIIALSLRDLRKAKQGGALQQTEMGKILRESSLRNRNCQSNIGLIRILPLTVFGLKLNDKQFENLVADELSLICPNPLLIETGLIYARMLRTIIITGDHQRAFYEASKWIYEKGSTKIKELWSLVEKDVEIESRGNMGKLKTSFTYSCIQINKKQINFFETLIHNLYRGGDTDANCAIVMTLIGAIVGYNGIPGYFKQKIINSKIKDSPRPRDQIYWPSQVMKVVENLFEVQPDNLIKTY